MKEDTSLGLVRCRGPLRLRNAFTPAKDPRAHGTSQQRIGASNLGYNTGDSSRCVF
jgi:predicted metalloprotease